MKSLHFTVWNGRQGDESVGDVGARMGPAQQPRGHRGEWGQFDQWRQGTGVRKTIGAEENFQANPAGPDHQALSWTGQF